MRKQGPTMKTTKNGNEPRPSDQEAKALTAGPKSGPIISRLVSNQAK